MIGVVTDSSAQLPPDVASRPDVRVVPIIVTLGDQQTHEGVDLDRDWFIDQLERGVKPSTSQPSPGEFAAAYRSLIDAGAESVVSLHVGSASSGTVNAARLGAELVSRPVHVIDTGLVSFGVSCCVLSAIESVDAGLTAEMIVESVAAFAPTVASSFLIQATELVRERGRSPVRLPDGHDGIMVFGGLGAAIDLIGTGHTVEDLARQMTEYLLSTGDGLLIAISVADVATIPFADAMHRLAEADPRASRVIRYEVNPSVLTYSGLGTAGGYSCRLVPGLGSSEVST